MTSRSKAFVGIDVGKKGSMAVLTDKAVSFFDFPDKEHMIEEYFNNIASELTNYSVELVCIEKVHSMPQQSAQSGFTFGENVGMWKLFLYLMKLPHTYVTPQKWMKSFDIHKSDGSTTKDQVQTQVKRLFPHAQVWTPRGKYLDGRGDALLMAYYAKRQMVKEE